MQYRMNTRLLFLLSSLLFGASGIALIFSPEALLHALAIEQGMPTFLFVKVVGGLYFGFSILNWMTKSNRTGGIYNRPIVMANLSYFVISGLGIVKTLLLYQEVSIVLWAVGILNLAFGLLFIFILFKHPY